MSARPFGEELPAAFLGGLVVHGVFELAACPEDSAFGRRIEAIGIEHGPLIVVAQQDDAALHDQIDAFAGIGTVADDITQAVDFLDLVLFDVLEDGLQCLKVAMNIANDSLHAVALPRPK